MHHSHKTERSTAILPCSLEGVVGRGGYGEGVGRGTWREVMEKEDEGVV